VPDDDDNNNNNNNNADNAINSESPAEDVWQWWRISFSTNDARARHVEASRGKSSAAPKNADVIGYTVRKVREIEVLRAARDESRTVLLVYANSNAMSIREDPIPPPLRVRLGRFIF
jgi:hypothetical protein